MNEQLTQEMIDGLNKPLPPEAIKPHPTKPYLSTIKPPFIIERLNEVFGVNGWYDSYEIVENNGPMVVAKVTLEAPRWGIKKYAYGGNNNDDRGDAYKGACTDALTKASSFLGIGLAVYKGEKGTDHEVHASGNRAQQNPTYTPQKPSPAQPPVAAKNTVTAKPTQQPTGDKPKPGTGQIEGNILHCKAPVVQEALSSSGKPYLQVMYWGTFTLPDGKQSKAKDIMVSCFSAHLFNAVRDAHLKDAYFKIETKGKYTNIVDVISVNGRDYDNGVPVIQVNEDLQGTEIQDDDIPF